MKTEKIEFITINNDSSGNPRYVCHFSNLVTEKETELAKQKAKQNQKKFPNNWFFASTYEYEFALDRAKKFFGKKFNNKQYGGGIVFSTYNLQDLEQKILKDLNS